MEEPIAAGLSSVAHCRRRADRSNLPRGTTRSLVVVARSRALFGGAVGKDV